MNRFRMGKCIDIKEEGYDGPSVVLSCVSDPEFQLFFPVPKDSASIINFVMDDNKYDVNTGILGIYMTMLNSWKSTDKYLSGVLMDSFYNKDLDDDALTVRLALSDVEGDLDSLVNVNFLHAVVLAAMEKVDIIISESLLNKMTSDENDEIKEEDKNEQRFPEDKKIVGIVRKIMSGKIKK